MTEQEKQRYIQDYYEHEGVHTEEANQVMVLLGKHLIGIHKEKS